MDEIKLTDEQIEVLHSLSAEEFEDLAAELDERISKACCNGIWGGTGGC